MRKNGLLSHAVHVLGLVTGTAVAFTLATRLTYWASHSVPAAAVAGTIVLLLTWPVLSTQVRDEAPDEPGRFSLIDAARSFALGAGLAAVTPGWVVVLTVRNFMRLRTHRHRQ